MASGIVQMQEKGTNAQAHVLASLMQIWNNQSMVSFPVCSAYLQTADDGSGVFVGLGLSAEVTGDGLGDVVSIVYDGKKNNQKN